MKNKPLKKGPLKKRQAKKGPVTKNRYADLFGLVIIILLGIMIYSDSFTSSFHFDDFLRITNNTRIRDLADVKAWWNSYPLRPVGMFTFALNYHFNHYDVWYYHLVNLSIHLINACLVWWLTLLIFSSPALKDNPIVRHKKRIAFFTALLFVSHPLATQSVTYIVQRMASMVAMFYLLTMTFYVKARLTQENKIARYLLYTGSLISAVLAMLTKENAFTLPFAIAFFELFFLRTRKLNITFKDYHVTLVLAAFLGLIIFFLLKFQSGIFKPIPPSNGNNYTITPLNYLFTQFSVIVKYIQLLLLPVNQNLDHDFPVSTNFFMIRPVLSFLGLLSLIILAIFLFKKYRLISFGIFWFFLTLSVESSFIPINDVIFEHRTYLPSFGFFLILSTVLYILFWNRYKYLALSLFLIIIAFDSILTYERNKVWKDDLTLWSDAVSKSPDKARPIINRGLAFENLGQFEKAISDYSRAIEIDPKFIQAWYDRGTAYGKLKQWDKTIDDCSEAIRIDPKCSYAYSNRGLAYENLGQHGKAITDYSEAIRIDPDYVNAYFNRGVTYANLGQWDRSIADYSKTISIDPDYVNAYYNRGVIYGSLGKWDLAIADYSKAIEIDPDFTMAYSNRGVAYGNLGRWDKAIADYSKAIEIDPNFKIAYSNREIAYRKLRSEQER